MCFSLITSKSITRVFLRVSKEHKGLTEMGDAKVTTRQLANSRYTNNNLELFMIVIDTECKYDLKRRKERI
jgi:hypothetical protein